MDINLNDYITTQDDPEELFQLLEKLGQGTYGSVYKALHKDSGKIVAAKIISIEGDVESFKKEIKILNECHSPYILRYFGSYYKSNHIWLIIEYCDAGSVLDVMKITKKNLIEEHIASIMQMVLRGLQFLHERKKIHRDIKAGNILLNHEGYAKLADFGVSAQMKNSFSKKNSRIGTPYWMSPEVIKKSEHNQSTDIWSLGITCVEMAEGEPPYSDTKPWKAMMIIISNPPRGLTKPHLWSKQFNSFISECLNIKAEKRPSAKELLNHPFIIEKARGCALISELVSTSIDEINKYRIERFNPDNDSCEIDEDEDNEKGTDNNIFGTVINNEGNGDYATMLINNGTIKNNTIQAGTVKNNSSDKDKKEAPEFMKYINEMDISYDEFKLETDLFQQMEKRKKGNDDDLRALNLMDDEKDTSSFIRKDHKTINADKDSISSESSKNYRKTNNRYSNKTQNNINENLNNNVLVQNSTSNFSEIVDKKYFVDILNTDENTSKHNLSNNIIVDQKMSLKVMGISETLSISKEYNGSTMKMSLNKPLMINPHSLLKKDGKIENKEFVELLEDNELKTMGVYVIEENLKMTYLCIEREIEQIRAKYSDKIKKYNYALEFLKSNPHLKNLKEYEDYSKFSKFLDQTKFSMYSNNDEGSIGGTSFLPLNNVKVHKYKDNNINTKNK